MTSTKRNRKRRAKGREKRAVLPRVQWVEGEPTKHGNRTWLSRDGMLMLICSEQFDGIAMPRLWVLWQWIRGGWAKVSERRGRSAVEKIARQRASAMDEE